jgi:hypothetical protein
LKGLESHVYIQLPLTRQNTDECPKVCGNDLFKNSRTILQPELDVIVFASHHCATGPCWTAQGKRGLYLMVD